DGAGPSVANDIQAIQWYGAPADGLPGIALRSSRGEKIVHAAGIETSTVGIPGARRRWRRTYCHTATVRSRGAGQLTEQAHMPKDSIVRSAVRVRGRRQRIAECIDRGTRGTRPTGIRGCICRTVIPVVVVTENALLHTGRQHLSHNRTSRLRDVVIPQHVIK